MKRKNRNRAKWKFLRNFGSGDFVDFTRRQPCLFCGSRDRVRTAHLLHARGMGGCGGSVKDAGPCCFGCDKKWERGWRTFLDSIGVSVDELERRVRQHHERFAAQEGPQF